ncbi:MAG: glycosyl hydrolase family 28 protein [Planctomycetota bacterium]|nr:glycosyl hydrolase family 28 protein [Planctomycetota bacterium]
MRMLWSFLALCGLAAAAETKVTTYPAPEGYPANARFKLSVAGQASHVHDAKASTEIKSHAWPYSNRFKVVGFSLFELDGTAEVKVEVLGAPPEHARILPTSLGIVPALEGSIITFRLERPVNAILELNRDPFEHLYLFATAPEKEPVDPRDPNVLYFGPGVHRPGAIQVERDGQTIYLAGGAVVKGDIRASGRKNLRIAGRGILTGDHHEPFVKINPIKLRGVEGLRIEDLLILDSSNAWNVRLEACRDVKIRGLRILAHEPTTDGVDPISCENVEIEGVFFRNYDDGVVCKAAEGKSCRNVAVRKSTFITDNGTSLKTGFGEMDAEQVSDIVFEDCDVIRPSGHAIKLSSGGRANVLNVRVENIRIEGFRMRIEGVREEGRQELIGLLSSPTYVYRNNFAPGTIRGIVLRNVAYVSSDPKVVTLLGLHGADAAGCVANVLFENVTFDGEPLHPGHPALVLNEHVHNLRFKAPDRDEQVARPRDADPPMPATPELPPLPPAEPVVNERGDILLEAECGEIERTMYRWADDPTASGKWYVGVKQGNTRGEPSDSTWATARYKIALANPGAYTLEGRMKGWGHPFWLRVDGGAWMPWGHEKELADWAWQPARDPESGRPLVFEWAAGEHTLVVSLRHIKAPLDQLRLVKVEK